MRVRLISDDGIVVELRHDDDSYQPSVMRELCDHARRLLGQALLGQALAEQSGRHKLAAGDPNQEAAE